MYCQNFSEFLSPGRDPGIYQNIDNTRVKLFPNFTRHHSIISSLVIELVIRITLRPSPRHAIAEPNPVVTVHTPRTKLTNWYISQASSDSTPTVSFGIFPSDTSTVVYFEILADSKHKAKKTRVNLDQSTTYTMPSTTNLVAHWSFKPKANKTLKKTPYNCSIPFPKHLTITNYSLRWSR